MEALCKSKAAGKSTAGSGCLPLQPKSDFMAKQSYSNPKKTSAIAIDSGKIPPQALDLEEAVLGAIMLEKDAILSVLDILEPGSFYKEAHQTI